ncbi:hypothetical protein [Clostridium felsineum]|uniref:Uncharacterized protein n=1 Tax=Clostridium felsineum TaxID=36839 RepID=A0A1S8M2M0_9CLOT|nr:hypothetical protein [Clostridium felsineum]MCR3758699.1 hypothetical protein [Clostridium felsineum]URZ04473.1 hypothetical protein CLAUR_045620 [Clostridium felsineum]URZ09278.1 hypothetical protein CLROS_046940 [Clostridium felsineum]URZ13964.1 hypothetical protein CROST_047420 [Clostridium felsineum]
MRKKILTGLTVVSLCVLTAIPAMAETVYYKNDRSKPISWDHGRTLGVFSYSDVNTHYYTHISTANTTSSGWKSPGVQAHAEQFVGTGTATAYWDCK